MSPLTAYAADGMGKRVCTKPVVPTPAGTCPKPCRGFCNDVGEKLQRQTEGEDAEVLFVDRLEL